MKSYDITKNYNATELLDWETKIIATSLLEHILKNLYNPLITYGNLARRANFTPGPRALKGLLGNFSDFCKANGLPLLSSVVVNAKDFVPGRGFFNYFYANIPEDKWYEKLSEEYEAIKNVRGELMDLLCCMKGEKVSLGR